MNAIVSVANDWAIGRDGGLIVRNKADMRRFVDLTRGCTCIMGRHTYESFPKGPLKGRRNIIVTHQQDYQPPKAEGLMEVSEDSAFKVSSTAPISSDNTKTERNGLASPTTSVKIVTSPEEALKATAGDARVWLIGGESLYKTLLPACSAVYLTRNNADVPDADAFFPNLDEDRSWSLVLHEGSGITEGGIPYAFVRYEHIE